MMDDETQLITVCDVCLTAACWKGIFVCAKANAAGTVDVPVKLLRELNLEHPDYWNGTYEKEFEKEKP